jgi:hypothetical protein
MTEPDTRQFRLFDPDGKEIMSGPMDAIMERLPDTKARNAALDQMLQNAVGAVEAEERQEQAVRSTVQMLADAAARLTQRLDAYVARRDARRKADEEEAEREEQLQIEAMLDALPDPDDPNQYPDPLLMADPQMPSPTEQDEELSYPSVPLSSAQEFPVGTDPVYDPAELAHPQKQPARPISISLNEE